jgi:hypothetical protein
MILLLQLNPKLNNDPNKQTHLVLFIDINVGLLLSISIARISDNDGNSYKINRE